MVISSNKVMVWRQQPSVRNYLTMDIVVVLVLRSCVSMIHSGVYLMQAVSKLLQQISVHQIGFQLLIIGAIHHIDTSTCPWLCSQNLHSPKPESFQLNIAESHVLKEEGLSLSLEETPIGLLLLFIMLVVLVLLTMS